MPQHRMGGAGAHVGRFRLERLLGEGGMGEVWSAVDVDGARRAIKLLKHAGASEERRRRFVREARAAMTIDHPNVARIHAAEITDDDQPYLVMDLLEGETLRAHLDRVGKLSLRDALAILMPVFDAVGAAHAHRIVHRDLKPENVFLSTDRVRVLDFGVAKFAASLSTPNLTDSGDRLGTPRYMAPEQARGSREVDHRADIWALGIMLWEALAGRHPIEGDSVGAIYKAITLDTIAELPGVPADVSALVARMLAREAADRPEDLREVVAVLAAYHEGATPVIAPAEAPAESRRSVTTVDDTLDRPSPGQPRRFYLVAAVVAALIALTIAVVLRAAHGAPPASILR